LQRLDGVAECDRRASRRAYGQTDDSAIAKTRLALRVVARKNKSNFAQLV